MILVADADAEAARRLADYLAERGYRTAHTARGDEALRVARTGDLRLAIVDVALSDMSGYALASRLKEQDPRILILMTSEDDRPEVEMRARRVGIACYTRKPASYHALEAVAAKALGGAKPAGPPASEAPCSGQ